MPHGSPNIRSETFTGSNRPLAGSVARPMVRFLALETASGVLLLIATAAALIWANSPWFESYHHFWETELGFEVGSFHLVEPLEAWVNDALMVIFFFVVGLEIKTEMVVGDLRDPRAAALPVVAALGGMVVPAGLFYLINAGQDGADGWGIPMATDIAFAVGVLAVIGRSVPRRLKLFLLTLAIADDIGAILVIALFYTASINLAWLGAAAGGLALMAFLRAGRVWYTPIYVIVGVFVWFATFESGVHATIAGVIMGLMTPARPLLGERAFENVQDVISGETADPDSIRNVSWQLSQSVSVAHRLINLLSPWSGFVIVPIFALANAGVHLTTDAVTAAATAPLTLGIIAGLVIGKPLGITLFTYVAVVSGISPLPPGVTWRHILGGGAVAGIGFTVALFITGLAFADSEVLSDDATIGVLVASLLATMVGFAVLRGAQAPSESGTHTPT